MCPENHALKDRADEKVARSIRRHKPQILHWFKANGEISKAAVERMNNKSKLTIRKAYGFQAFRTEEITLYHALGKLSEPEWTHIFW